MYDFRDYMARESGMDLLVHINPEGVEKNINPFDHGSALHTDVMKTEALSRLWITTSLMLLLAGQDETKKRAELKSVCFLLELLHTDGTLKTSAPSYGIYTTAKRIAMSQFASFQSLIGPNWMFGNIFIGNRSRLFHCTLPPSAR